MRFHWLLLTFFSVFLFCSPAKAGKLISWQFESEENRLVFITDEGVQPTAQLLTSPTRLVIDLPGTNLGRETVKERYSGNIRSMRVGQFDEQTTRIVVELAPGYTLDPQQVKFRGTSSNQWTVELPKPKIEPLSSTLSRSNSARNEREPQTISIDPQAATSSRTLPRLEAPRPLPSPKLDPNPRNRIVDTLPSTSPPIAPNPSGAENTVLITNSPYVRPTRNGFFIGIDGNRNNQISVQRSRDRAEIDFELEGVNLPPALASKAVAVNQYGVNQIEFRQTSPTQARMILKLDPDSPDWNASFSRIRGLVLVPKGGLSPRSASTLRSFPTDTPIEKTTAIEKIELAEDDTQLLISANRNVTAQTKYNRYGTYEIYIPNAVLANSDTFQGPELDLESSISEVRVRQENTSVVVEIKPRLGFRLGKIDSQEQKIIALPILKGLTPPPPRDNSLLSPSNRPLTLEVPQPESQSLSRPFPSRSVPHSKPLVIIDPGHGGQDPGTIGIGGLREKDLVLPISLDVAEGLREQGIEVRMTRDSDYFISLQGRTDFANNINADLFVSIHANAINLSRPDVNGLETYYYKSGRRLAEVIHWSILNGVNIKNRGIRRARFYVLRHSAMPAVLVEVGFVTGAEDAPRLKNPTHRSQMADAIVRGIVQYIKQKGL